jgi:hypothetical protein
MYALLIILVHVAISGPSAFAVAPYSLDAAATGRALCTLCMVSALLSATGFAVTATYLSRRIRLLSGAQVGLACGAVCSGIIGLALGGMRFSLIVYLAILVPTLAAVLLAALLDKPKSGWQA